MAKRKVKIDSVEDTSITEPINNLELADYTIFAGENNAGKTHLMKAIKSKVGEENTIYIPAESIDAKSAAKTGAADDSMRVAISKLLKVTGVEELNVKGDFEKLFADIMKTFHSFGVPNTKLKLEAKEFEGKDFEKIIADSIAKRILQHSTIDKWGDEDDEVDIDKVGQGIQRLIIASILQEVGRVEVEGDEIIILFEEPEIYLHPQLKEKLHDTLFTLSQEPKMRVVISTHDLQFIELGKNQEIYNVFRDEDSGSTQVQKIETNDGYLGYRSYAEINYLIFKLTSNTYFLELYEKLLSNFSPEGKCEKCKKDKKSQYSVMRDWLKSNGATMINSTNPRVTKLRNSISHRTKKAAKYKVEKDDIEEMIGFIQLAER